jgi:hypothetical protein
MAATAFTIYDKAKKKLMDGTIDLNTNVFKGQLHTSASNASTSTISLVGSITNEVSNGNGYTTGGKSLTTITWTVGASASEYRWDAVDMVWTATGGSIANVKYLVIKSSAGHALCWSRLSSSQFTVTIGNTLTVVFSANGIFELN